MNCPLELNENTGIKYILFKIMQYSICPMCTGLCESRMKVYYELMRNER